MVAEVFKKLGPNCNMGVLHWASYGAALAAFLFITLSLGLQVPCVSVAG